MNTKRKLLCYGPNCYPLKKKHDREELELFRGKNYCIDCFKIVTKNVKDRDDLYTILRAIYNTNIIPAMVHSQIKKFKNEGMTYRGIFNTIHYLEDIRGYHFELKYGIGLVRNYYYDGQNYHKEELSKSDKIPVQTSKIHTKLGVRNRALLREIDRGDLLNG